MIRACAGVASEERAQATVEMAVVTPVLIVLALIVYNVMLFVSATARFDRVVPDVVIAQGVSPVGAEADASADDMSGQIRSALSSAMDGYGVEVEVACAKRDGLLGDSGELSMIGELKTYRCTMKLKPWPASLSIAGVDMGAPAFLKHARDVTIDPWKPGVVM